MSLQRTQPLNLVLLDLDGTLLESGPGIFDSVIQTFKDMQLPVPDQEELRRFIGPSIMDSLIRNHVPDDRLEEGVDTYRKYYTDVPISPDPRNPDHLVPGNLNSSLYEGITQELDSLRAQGFILAIATCKPEYQAKPICAHTGLSDHLDYIFGASKDSSRREKSQVIEYAFQNLGFNRESGDRALMVGDRWTDADGAQICKIDCLGCAWGGYAEEGEMKAHHAYRVIDKVEELSAAVTEYFN